MATGIEWTDETWNPMTGCTEISAGCANCYAHVVADGRTKAAYLRQPPVHDSRETRDDPFAPRFWPARLEKPAAWRAPRRVFVNSMSDLFHAHFTREQIFAVLDVIAAHPRHDFQVLTKRPERARRVLADYSAARGAPLPGNLWLGVTVENRDATRRIDVLRTIPVAIRFLSCEPLLEDLEGLDLSGIDWVILGGESGRGCRPCDESWMKHALTQASAEGCAVFVKQLGGFPDPRAKEKALLWGQLWKKFPRPHPSTRAA